LTFPIREDLQRIELNNGGHGVGGAHPSFDRRLLQFALFHLPDDLLLCVNMPVYSSENLIQETTIRIQEIHFSSTMAFKMQILEINLLLFVI